MVTNVLLPAVLVSLLLLTVGATAAQDESSLNLVPWPQALKVDAGTMSLTPQSRIVAGDAALEPLARVLADEIALATGIRLAAASGQPAAGDIALSIDRALKDEAHKVTVTDKATVQGGSYGAVALGTVTLLQALDARDGKVSIPCLAVTDEPKTAFRGLLVDVARRYHSIENLKQMAQLCRLYKIRYLQLHLTDDQSFTFPSKTYPQLATKNQHGGKTYTLDELKDLVAYADARNVTIIPEYEVPGHSAAANRAMPDLFVIRGTKPYEHHASINFAKDEVLQAVATIVGEMCEVFKSSPYFHIGGDEADLALANQNEDFKAAFKKHNLPNQHQLYRKFVVDMNEIVKKNGKQTIVWEGFGREANSPVKIPNDIIVMAYEIRFYMPNDLVKDGYKVVNASWTPLYVVNTGRPPAEIYAWQLRQFKPFGAKPADQGVIVPPAGEVFGAEMCAWEQPEVLELPNERLRLPAMSERIWNPAAGKTCKDFERRLAATDRLLDLLVHNFTVQCDGLANLGDCRFDKPLALTVAAAPALKGATVRFTVDGKEPAANSPACAEPIRIATTTDFKARAFDADGKPLGYPRWTRYEFQPISADAQPLLPNDRFCEPLTLTLKSTAPGEIRYTLDGKDPTANSPACTAPLKIEKSTTVKAALFAAGKRQGEIWGRAYAFVNYEKNLTTGKPVTASGVEAGCGAENAVDGIVDLNAAWWAGPYPQWLQVDLEKACKLNRVHVFPYWGGGRYYQYTVEASLDAKTWTQVVDASKNTKPSTPEGFAHDFAPTEARYLRLNMLKNSANQGVHVVEFRAYSADAK
ncbi:MAG: family 20 glycosylhydrolase [Planctomycetota bacterium]|nr:family 20 glycosylhydrolase [Planctomycetota bacterium]